VIANVEAIVPVSDLDRAIEFFRDTVGLELVERLDLPQNPMARFSAGGNGTIGVYESVGAGQSRATVAALVVDDIYAAVDELRGRGVTFEEYDMGDLQTDNGIARFGEVSGAWFKDPDGNILSVSTFGGAS
jgi:catechol 2,3-dioxygenase-like lactoylglutathione lyase family enzyme